jgi:hypothetical protein
MLAYHSDPKLKAKYLSRVRRHRKADEIIHGVYWENGKGCAVGCTIHSANHYAYETELGIPTVLARLEDGIFESLPNGESKLWPEQFLSAIAPGADLSLVWPRFAVWLLLDEEWGAIRHAKKASTKAAIQAVGDAYAKVVAGAPLASIDWRKLRYAAYAAAAYAASGGKARQAQAVKLLSLLKEAICITATR